jgi:DnaJ-class molecular chaperone
VDSKLERIRELIDLKEATDAELSALISGGTVEVQKSKSRACKTCGKPGHRSDTCPEKAGTSETPAASRQNSGVVQ